MVLMLLINSESLTQFQTLWKIEHGTYPFNTTTTDGYRGLVYNPFTNHVLVVRYTPTIGVYVFDANNGQLIDSLNVTGISGGTLGLVKIDIADDGAIYACNLTSDWASTSFKIYRWNSEYEGRRGGNNQPPQVVYNATVSSKVNVRLGDAFNVAGSGTSTVILVSGNTSVTRAYKFTTSDGVNFNFTDSINIRPQSAAHGIFQVSAGGNFYASRYTIGWKIYKYSPTGTPLDSIPSGVSDTHGNVVYFEAFGRKFIATAPEFTNASGYQGNGAKLIDVTNGETLAYIWGKTPSLGTNSNGNATGAIDVKIDNIENSITLFVLVGLNGIAAYKTYYSSSGVTKYWDGGANTDKWSDPNNWDPDGVPGPNDDVILDNSRISGSYTVKVDASTQFSVKSLKIGYIGNPNTITLEITSDFPELYIGDGVANNDDLLIEKGGVLQNSSSAQAGDVLVRRLPARDKFKVANEGRINHNTLRSVASPWFTAGPAEFDLNSYFEYQTNSATSITASGRTYGHLILNSTTSKTYTATGTSPLTVTDFIISNSNVTFNSTMTGDMRVRGNWINNGSFLSTQKVVFQGSSPQTIGGTNSTIFSKLEINNSSGVLLANSVIDTVLIFTNGKLTTGSNTIKVIGSISGAGAGKFVDGNLVYPISSTGSKKWETGQGSDYLPATINFTSLSGSGDVTVSVLDRTSTPPGGPIGDNKVLKRFFRINQSGLTSFNADLTLTYTDADVSEQGISDENSLRVFQWDGSQWKELTVTARNTTDNTITVTGVTSFSDFVISGTGDAPLPVQVTKVSAEVVGNVVKLRIKTQVESSEFLGFEIYRSRDNVNYVLAGSYLNNSGLKSKGGEMFGGDYEFVDKEITGSGKVYYRIEAVSKVERKLIDVVEIEIEVPKNYVLHQNYPNPFNPATTIEFEIPVGGNVVLELYNSAGQKVMDIFSGELPAGYHKIRFDGSNLASGVYFYVLRVNGFVGVKKMVLVK